MADKVQIDQLGVGVIYDPTAQVEVDQAGVAVIWDLIANPEIRISQAGIAVIYSDLPEELNVNLGLAQVDVIPLPMTGVLIGRRKYPTPTDARGYGTQDKRRFPIIQ
jgi:hypothetical protein